jgi:hypothetical protein
MVSKLLADNDCPSGAVVAVKHVNNIEDLSVNITAKVDPLYRLSTLKVVPVAADRVPENTPEPEAGEVRALKAMPSTRFELRAALLNGPVPTVSNCTVLNPPEPPDSEKFKLSGGNPKAESACEVKLMIDILLFILDRLFYLNLMLLGFVSLI